MLLHFSKKKKLLSHNSPNFLRIPPRFAYKQKAARDAPFFFPKDLNYEKHPSNSARLGKDFILSYTYNTITLYILEKTISP